MRARSRTARRSTSIQRNLASNPREHFEFGLFEGAIGHFHRQLSAVIDERVTSA